MLTIISIGELRNFDTLSTFTFQLNTLPQKKAPILFKSKLLKYFCLKFSIKKDFI